MEHQWEYHNGFKVCINCGLVDGEDRQISYTKPFNRLEDSFPAKHLYKLGRWNRLFKVDKYNSNFSLFAHFENVINQLPISKND